MAQQVVTDALERFRIAAGIRGRFHVVVQALCHVILTTPDAEALAGDIGLDDVDTGTALTGDHDQVGGCQRSGGRAMNDGCPDSGPGGVGVGGTIAGVDGRMTVAGLRDTGLRRGVLGLALHRGLIATAQRLVTATVAVGRGVGAGIGAGVADVAGVGATDIVGGAVQTGIGTRVRTGVADGIRVADRGGLVTSRGVRGSTGLAGRTDQVGVGAGHVTAAVAQVTDVGTVAHRVRHGVIAATVDRAVGVAARHIAAGDVAGDILVDRSTDVHVVAEMVAGSVRVAGHALLIGFGAAIVHVLGNRAVAVVDVVTSVGGFVLVLLGESERGAEQQGSEGRQLESLLHGKTPIGLKPAIWPFVENNISSA